MVKDENWKVWKEIYFEEQKEIEARDLGGVRVRQNTEVDSEDSFDFSIEEIRSRFSDFLNPSADVSIDAESGSSVSDSKSEGGNVDEWLRGILPNKIDEVDDMDPEFISQKVYQITQNNEIDSLLEELGY